MQPTSEIKQQLNRAINSGDPDAFEDALDVAFDAHFPGELADILAAALLVPWHTRHEDIALALQELRDPSAVDALYQAALVSHPYLNYDDNFGLARKCTWALADIGTTEARMRLNDLSQVQIPLIAGYAKKRLDRWQEELPRKGYQKRSD